MSTKESYKTGKIFEE